MQTLSRLNRCYPGKDTTYVLDFVNEPDEVLAAFKTYYETAELAGVTDPNLVYDLRAKLDASGYYDDFEVERVVAVELDPKATQKQLAAAVEPVADRLLKRYKADAGGAGASPRTSRTRPPEQAAKDEMDALILFKRNMATLPARLHASSPRSSTTATPTSRSGRSSSSACCRCWSSAASARGSISPRSSADPPRLAQPGQAGPAARGEGR